MFRDCARDQVGEPSTSGLLDAAPVVQADAVDREASREVRVATRTFCKRDQSTYESASSGTRRRTGGIVFALPSTLIYSLI